MEKIRLNEDDVLKRLSNGEMWHVCGGVSGDKQTKNCPRISDTICTEVPPLTLCSYCTVPQDSLKCQPQALCGCPEWGQFDCDCPPKHLCIPVGITC